MVLQTGGLLEIIANKSGRIDKLTISPGDEVRPGMVIARFKRSTIIREIKLVKAELSDTEGRLASLVEYYSLQRKNETANETDRLAGLQETERLLKRRRNLLGERLKGVRELVKRKVAIPTKLINAELELTDVHEKLSRMKNEANHLRTDALKRKRRRDLALLDEKLKIDKLKRQITRLEKQLEDDQTVTSPHAGRVIEIKMKQGDVIDKGMPLALLAPLADEKNPDIAVLYVSTADGKRVKPGMDVEIVPSLYRKSQYGFIRGKVIYVSTVPTTLQGMRSVLRNEQLAKELAGGGSPFEVRVRFERDPASPSGLRWSSSDGPASAIHPGTLLEASIVVERLPIADIVIPGLAGRLGLQERRTRWWQPAASSTGFGERRRFCSLRPPNAAQRLWPWCWLLTGAISRLRICA